MLESKNGSGRKINNLFFWCMCLFFCSTSVWLYKATLDVVSVAYGEVVPASKLKSIQHLEGGIVSKISVSEGTIVSIGDPLIVLENTISGAKLSEIKTRLVNLKVESIRLAAESEESRNLIFPPKLLISFPDLVLRNKNLFIIRRKRYNSEISAQIKRIKESQQLIEEIKVRQLNDKKSLALITEQILISESLLKDDLTNRYNHLDLLKDGQIFQGRINSDTEKLKGSRFALQKEKLLFDQIKIRFKEESRERHVQVNREFDEVSEIFKRYKDSFSRGIVRAPVNGVIKSVYKTTIGGVVKPGEILVDIFPIDDALVVEVQLPTYDVGYVEVGQIAKLKLSAPSLQRYGEITGTVQQISPDKLVRKKDGLPYFKIRIKPDAVIFTRGKETYKLFPGSQIIASIITGKRTIFEYLAEPFIGHMNDAFRER